MALRVVADDCVILWFFNIQELLVITILLNIIIILDGAHQMQLCQGLICVSYLAFALSLLLYRCLGVLCTHWSLFPIIL